MQLALQYCSIRPDRNLITAAQVINSWRLSIRSKTPVYSAVSERTASGEQITSNN